MMPTAEDILRQRLLAAGAILNKRRCLEDCPCSRCTEAKERARESFACKTCGYSGLPSAWTCACYDSSCPGGEHSGAGCFHGAIVCPVCDDGEGDVDPWEILRELRALLGQ